MTQRKTLFFIIMLFIIPLSFSFAQDELPWGEEGFSYYQEGNQNFIFAGGVKFPLFYYFPFDNEVDTHGFKTAGWHGSLGWEMFASDSLAFGVELGYARNALINHARLVQIPVLFTTRWYPFSDSQLDFPLVGKAGAAYTNIDDMEDQTYFAPTVSVGGGILWRAFDSWSFGIEANYSLSTEIYFGENRDNTALGNFFTIALTASFTNR